MKKKLKLLFVFFILFQITYSQYSNFEVIKLNETNSKYSDFGVSTFGTDLLFASTRKNKKVSTRKWQGNGQPYLDLFKGSPSANGEIQSIRHYDKGLNSRFHDSNPVFTKDLQTVYFTRNNLINNKFIKNEAGWNLIQLYKATIDASGNWINIQPLSINSDDYQTGHPVLNVDETKLYFTSDMPGGFGETDIWVVDILENGSLGAPVNLGAKVNSSAKDMFPFISESGRLFFASERQGGYGGLDLYESTLVESNTFNKAENLGHTINSNKDDFAIVLDEVTHSGYFSSNRDGGVGDDDIYFFRETNYPEAKVCEPIIVGKVRDFPGRALLPGSIVHLYNDQNQVLEKIRVSNSGSFVFDIPLKCGEKYKIIASKELYREASHTFILKEEDDGEKEVELFLEKDFIVNDNNERCINVEPIYFNYDTSYIRGDAAIELDKVVAAMHKYPNIIIQATSHTDSRAPYNYNRNLSNRRAAATKNYIVSRGISRSRITAIGYGESQLVNECADNIPCSEEKHQANRRTEFIVICNF